MIMMMKSLLKNQTQQKSVFTVQIMNNRDNLIAKTRYKDIKI